MTSERAPSARSAEQVPRTVYALVITLFFFSGAAGLVYQVLWMRHLGLFLGSDAYGISIILGSFMGGLAIGSLLGGALAQRSRHPLLWYGVAELGIGLFAFAFPALLDAFGPWLHQAFPQDAARPGLTYHLVRVGMAVAVLLIPTTLMGATLPLVLRHFVRDPHALGQIGATFYATNTLGALVGTLTAGFVLLPYLGMRGATACAAVINLSIGIVCSLVGLRATAPEGAERAGSGPASGSAALDPLPGLDGRARARVARSALWAIAVSGFASFAFEVVWTRILVMSFSATVYSFATMLACFLFGIFLGSRLIARRVDDHPNPTALFAALELGIGLSVAVLSLLLHAVPGIFGRLLVAVAAALGDGREHALVVSSILASVTLLLVPTTLLGATFSVALRAHTTSVAQVGRRSGEVYAANTLGAILGSVLGGLLILPTLGATPSLALVAVVFSATGAMLARTARAVAPESALPGGRVLAALGASGVFVALGLLLPYQPTLNFNQEADAGAELVFHAEGVGSTVDVLELPSGVRALVIGGNVEADNGYRQLRHFVLKGHLPLMLHEDPKTVLVVGLGMGITTRSTARHPGLERIDVIELSPEIVEAQRTLREINDDVLAHPLVKLRIDDGRAFLKHTERRYDMITADPIHPKISRVGYLYTREYYQSIRDHLEEGGIVCQWMPIYQISPLRMRSALATFLDVFPNATLWYVDSHALLIASRDGDGVIDYPRLEARLAMPAVKEDLATIDLDRPEDIAALLLMGPEELRAFALDGPQVPLNTDDYPYLEYFVPRDLFLPSSANVEAFARWQVDPRPLLRGLSPEASQRIGEQLEGREERLLSE